MNEQTEESFEALLRYMRDSRGFDFTGYKRTTLMRRVRHRMDQDGCDSFEDYLDLLQASSDEFAALFNTILINVTAFFCDAPAWEFVKDDVIPSLLADRAPTEPIRVWSAGWVGFRRSRNLTPYASSRNSSASAGSEISTCERSGRWI